MDDKRTKSIGIKEIAAALNISIGTVDRALHARPGVNPKTRAQVLKMAEKLNYRPNLAARNLKLNHRLRIGVYLPQQIASFFTQLRAGVSAGAVIAHGLNVELESRRFLNLKDGDAELLQIDTQRKYDGIIIAPADPVRVDPVVRRLSQQGTAVVCVASDAPRSERLAGITIDATVSGDRGGVVRQDSSRKRDGGDRHRAARHPGPRRKIARICRDPGHVCSAPFVATGY